MKIDLDAFRRAILRGLDTTRLAERDDAPPAEPRGLQVRTELRAGKGVCKGFAEKGCGGEAA